MSFESLVEDVLAGRRRQRNGSAIFTATAAPASSRELDDAEARLGVRLPASYRWFVSRAGSGDWCGEYIPSPAELYPFDEDVGKEMVGMIGVVWNADRTGDYVAFRPKEAAAHPERLLYLCSHDPYGLQSCCSEFCRLGHGPAGGQRHRWILLRGGAQGNGPGVGGGARASPREPSVVGVLEVDPERSTDA